MKSLEKVAVAIIDAVVTFIGKVIISIVLILSLLVVGVGHFASLIPTG